MSPTTIDTQHMETCLHLAAQAAQNQEVPVGAAIVRSKTQEILVASPNRREELQTPLGHAEIIAIHQASRKLGTWRLTGYTLYTTLEPCVMCCGVIVQARLDRIVYGASDPKGGGQSLFNLLNHPQLNHRVALTSGLLATQCSEILRDFFAFRRV